MEIDTGEYTEKLNKLDEEEMKFFNELQIEAEKQSFGDLNYPDFNTPLPATLNDIEHKLQYIKVVIATDIKNDIQDAKYILERIEAIITNFINSLEGLFIVGIIYLVVMEISEYF